MFANRNFVKKAAKMSSLIKNLHIQNYKSVRELSLECDRINIFIGKPNAGKSNILEAISLLGAGYSEGRFMEGFIRYQTIMQLFTDYEFQKDILVRSEKIEASLIAPKNGEEFVFVLRDPARSTYKRPTRLGEMINAPQLDLIKMDFDLTGKLLSSSNAQANVGKQVKKYEFKSIQKQNGKGLFLNPPHGDNFYFIVRSHKELREEIQQFMKPNGLKLLLDEDKKQILLVQETEDSLRSFPLHLVPDTFQRYIFHLAAIMSNRDSVMLFEEPEAHSYAPYIYQLAQHILNDEGENQYFITTHNPYFLLPIMQEGKDVAVFATWFKDYQTYARRLSEEEIREALDYGVDMFLNLDHFIPA